MKLFNIPLNIPNILSLYRLVSFPFGLYLAFSEQEQIFVWLICINLITDILDGLIARAFNMQTEIGARIDSLADVGTYILAILGIFIFKSEEFTPHWISFGIFIGMFLMTNIVGLIKFGRFPSLHLYSSKIGGYIQGIFFFVLFVTEFYTPFYYFMITWAISSFTEHIIIQLITKEMKSNLKGLYWVLKEGKNGN
ncbi:MAG: cardiolipin synthase [Cognaticolwellia sp.]|jgi:cardiolipin synthase